MAIGSADTRRQAAARRRWRARLGSVGVVASGPPCPGWHEPRGRGRQDVLAGCGQTPARRPSKTAEGDAKEAVEVAGEVASVKGEEKDDGADEYV